MNQAGNGKRAPEKFAKTKINRVEDAKTKRLLLFTENYSVELKPSQTVLVSSATVWSEDKINAGCSLEGQGVPVWEEKNSTLFLPLWLFFLPHWTHPVSWWISQTNFITWLLGNPQTNKRSFCLSKEPFCPSCRSTRQPGPPALSPAALTSASWSVFTWKAPQQLQLWVCSVNPLCQTS